MKRLECRGRRLDSESVVVGLRTGTEPGKKVWNVRSGVELCPGVVRPLLNVLFLETSHPLKNFEDPEELWFVWIIFIDILY